MRILVIYNPHAGAKRAEKLFTQVKAFAYRYLMLGFIRGPIGL